MKLRIKGNSLRLRVSRSELASFLRGERVEDTVHFATTPGARLTYALECASLPVPVKVRYEAQSVTIQLSEVQASVWGEETEVGVYTSVEIGGGCSLEIIVEKDFACLDRSDEDNTDTFANPHSEAVC
ncbi:hypothetical protein JAO29_14530 [Edaphobacter sp. HDX4]|uniref:DUF7009 family protein n=1 Tax=Edaphobacter sp. HDX4 TaxID=2794064 RepID=UPI002FE53234